jgi:oligopeptide transport system substrate-binding protein
MRALSFLLRLTLPLALLGLAACSRPPAAEASSGDPAASPAPSAKVLQVGNGTEPQDLDPHLVTGVTEHHLIISLLEGLITDHPSGEGYAPGVAERWENSSDRLTWTFHLRPDARWSNGDPVTAQDFIQSFRRILTPSMAAEYAYKLHHVVGAQEYNEGKITDFSAVGFSAPDARTLVMQLKHPVPYLPYSLKHYAWFPVHLPTLAKHGPIDQKTGNRWTRPENFVGNGPFALKEWRANQYIRVERSPTYWDTKAVKLDAIVFHAIDDVNTEERAFRGGQLHVTSTVPPDKIATYRRDQPGLLRIDPYYGTYYYRFNLTRPPLDDVRVRRALALSIDREQLIRAAVRGGQEPALSFTPRSENFAPELTLPTGPAALDEARRLLAEAGYPGGRGLRRLEILYNTQDTHKAIAEAIQQMWRTGLGVESSLRNEEWKVYLDSQDTLQFDIARAGWIGDYPDPHTFLEIWNTGGGNNDTGYANPAYDSLLAGALSSPDEAARMATYRQLDALITRDLPVLPLYFYKRVFLIDPKVQNWVPNILDNRRWQDIDLAN